MLETSEAGQEDVHKQGFIRLMAETLPLAGYAGVRADLPGWDVPEIVHGAMRDHRPSLSCASASSRSTPAAGSAVNRGSRRRAAGAPGSRWRSGRRSHWWNR